jgi:iron complex transport system substrate-binding protein
MRIISLLPSATEIVSALGAVERLVGVTHACDYPPQIQTLPRLTSTRVDSAASPGAIDRDVREIAAEGLPLYDVDEQLLASLEPDVIVTQALCDVCAVRETDVRAIAARLPNQATVVTLNGASIDGIMDDISRVAAAIDALDEAEELIAGLRARLRSVHERLKAAAASRPAVAVVEWSDPVFSGGHWVPEMVRRAGGSDVIARPGEHSHVVSLADLEAADPDLILFAPCGYDLTRATREAEQVLHQESWRWATARSAWALDANALASRPGPRVIDGVETMASVFHPEIFGEPPLDRATKVSAD